MKMILAESSDNPRNVAGKPRTLRLRVLLNENDLRLCDETDNHVPIIEFSKSCDA